jgi:hypothetical protein
MFWFISILQLQNFFSFKIFVFLKNQVVSLIESHYDKYSAMLYGIALEISPSSKEAEIILIKTFEKAYSQNLMNSEKAGICGILIKLVIQSAHEVLLPKELKHNFKLNRFEDSPLLHQLLCEQISVNEICLKNKLSSLEVSQKIREEFKIFRNPIKEKS